MILATNDDGVNSPSVLPLLNNLDKETFGIFPSEEKSWIGKAISKQALKVESIKIGEREVFKIDGTPADCVQIGVHHLLKEKPKLVVSGINCGANVGHSYVLSSGTIGACIEASIMGIKSIAFSFRPSSKRAPNEEDFLIPARISRQIIEKALKGFEADFLIVNFPTDCEEDAKTEVTKMARFDYGSLYNKAGEEYVHRGYTDHGHVPMPGTDITAVAEGRISITPVDIELTSQNLDSIRRQFA